ncbi:helix-turn-helix transcriptional regulator, partial [Stenotrophomonas sp. Sm10]|uniref:helix-turn-helix domain-containing protein n=2 Tax=Bacteria TaxID=2 RepID=UPI0027E3C72C
SMFSTFEIVKDLCEKQGISLNTLEDKLKLGKNSLYGLKRNQPSAERLQQIADYFNVSTDYLLGRTKNPYTSNDDLMNTQELETLIMFRKETEDMSDDEKERFNKALFSMMKNARALAKDDSFWK